MSPALEALIAAAKERLHRSIAQRTRRAHEAIAAQAIRAEVYGAPEQPKKKGKK